MMNNLKFEDYKDELNNSQFNAMIKIASGLKTKVGIDKAVSSEQIAKGMASINIHLSIREINSLIHLIRRDGIIPNLISTPKNAFYIGTNEEVKAYIKLLEKKENYFKGIRVALLLNLEDDIKTV